jgi:hypothetical protein
VSGALDRECRGARVRGCSRAAQRSAGRLQQIAHVQLAAQLAVALELDVDALVQGEPDQVQRLLDRVVLIRHNDAHFESTPEKQRCRGVERAIDRLEN